MSDWLDLVGSFIIGGLIILMVINLNMTVNNAATQQLYSNVTQRQVVSAVEVVEHDLYKIGYRVGGSMITKADSTEISFYSDIDNDGLQDEVQYYLTGSSSMAGTINPNDKILKREVNSSGTITSIIVTELNFSYYDSLGQSIDYSNLTDQLNRNKIKTVKIVIETQTGELINDEYETIKWEKTIRPKNI